MKNQTKKSDMISSKRTESITTCYMLDQSIQHPSDAKNTVRPSFLYFQIYFPAFSLRHTIHEKNEFAKSVEKILICFIYRLFLYHNNQMQLYHWRLNRHNFTCKRSSRNEIFSYCFSNGALIDCESQRVKKVKFCPKKFKFALLPIYSPRFSHQNKIHGFLTCTHLFF